MKEPFDYLHATDYGYVDMTRKDFYGKRVFTADEYVQYCGTHSDHILIPEPYKTCFFEGLRNAVLDAGNKVEFIDTYVLYLAKKKHIKYRTIIIIIFRRSYMDNMSLPIITINREYGAGGRSLAACLSKRLGISYYDRDFISKTADESGYDSEDIEREGEEISVSSSVINSMFKGIVSYNSSHDAIFEAEKKVIFEYSKSPCILVGRCANRILDEAGVDYFSIYLHAPLKFRLKRAAELGENGDVKLEKYVEKRDRMRQIFFKKYTGREIFDATIYSATFDMSKISIEVCADAVIDMIKGR